ncbi:hypothetical protein IWX47DRAFT_210304 [Phyllosticta citricarpa]
MEFRVEQRDVPMTMLSCDNTAATKRPYRLSQRVRCPFKLILWESQKDWESIGLLPSGDPAAVGVLYSPRQRLGAAPAEESKHVAFRSPHAHASLCAAQQRDTVTSLYPTPLPLVQSPMVLPPDFHLYENVSETLSGRRKRISVERSDFDLCQSAIPLQQIVSVVLCAPEFPFTDIDRGRSAGVSVGVFECRLAIDGVMCPMKMTPEVC